MGQLLMGNQLIGSSPAIDRVRSIAMKAAEVDSTVLILGESGTGKDVTARYIHSISARSNEPFVAINCGGVPSELLASELFGHERGAFTGAVSRAKGCFERAGKGTLFLDEIGEMSLEMQVKLLRVLQDRQVERLGNQGNPIPVQARVIAATNQDLWENVQNKKFRSDLYYRLHVLPIHLPALRDRLDDFDDLIDFALQVYTRRGLTPPRFSKKAHEVLRLYSWPGNIRQLFNMLERFCVLYPGNTIHPHDLPGHVYSGLETQGGANPERPFFTHPSQGFFDGFNIKSYLDDVETNLIQTALEEADGVIARAARLLGLRRTTLAEKIRRRPELGQVLRHFEKGQNNDNLMKAQIAS